MRYQQSFPTVVPHSKADCSRVTHPFATKLFFRWPEGQLPKSSVRLACVRRAASVRPEPGSNSLKFVSKSRFRLSNLFLSLSNANLHFCFVFVCPELLLEFSGYIILIKYCSIFKEQLPLREDSLFILAHLSTFVNTFLKKFLFFLKNISPPFQSSFSEFIFSVPFQCSFLEFAFKVPL